MRRGDLPPHDGLPLGIPGRDAQDMRLQEGEPAVVFNARRQRGGAGLVKESNQEPQEDQPDKGRLRRERETLRVKDPLPDRPKRRGRPAGSRPERRGVDRWRSWIPSFGWG